MTLSPDEVRQIAEAVLAYSGPATFAGFIAAVICGIVIALKVTAPAAKRLIVREMNDPTGEVARNRAEERRMFLEDTDVLIAKRLGDLDNQKQRVEAKLEELRLSIPDLKPMQATLESTAAAFNATVPILKGLTPESLDARLDAAIKRSEDRRRMAGVRDARTGEDDRDTQDRGMMANMARDPEGTALLDKVLAGLKYAGNKKFISAVHAKEWAAAAKTAFAENGRAGLEQAIAELNILPEWLTGGVSLLGSGGGGVARGSKSAPAQF